MKRTLLYICLAVLPAVFFACEKAGDAPSGSGVPVAFHTRVVSDGAYDSESSARILIWREHDFHNGWIQHSASAYPQYYVVLDEEINHYRFDNKIYYETPYTYPLNYSTIHATGYAPDNVLSPVSPGDYRILKADRTDGTVDMLTCDGLKEHSANMNPENLFLKKEKELQFRHLTSRISFIGVRDQEMEALVGVRNVHITLHNDGGKLVVPSELRLYTEGHETAGTDGTNGDDDKSTYIMSAHEVPDEFSMYYQGLVPLKDDLQPGEKGAVLGNCYVLSGGFRYGREDGMFDPFGAGGKGQWVGSVSGERPRLKITVKATLYNANPDEDQSSAEETWEYTLEESDWRDGHVTGDMFLPGYEYRIIVRFNRVGIAIKAEAVPWNSEELHEYPIYPIDPVR